MFSLPDAARHLGSTLRCSHPQTYQANAASIDTRTLRSGNLFFALSGTQSDGHVFLEQAFEQGASGAVVSEEWFSRQAKKDSFPKNFKNILVVQDPAEALAKLGLWHREAFSIPFIGITGSVGKTSTKEFLSYLLRASAGADSVLATQGNYNNHLGLPLTLLNLEAKHRFCVAEIGANAPGDIAFLCRILKPTAGILTCVAAVHLEGMGSLEGIYNTKTDLFRALPDGAFAVSSCGDTHLNEIAASLPVRFSLAGADSSALGFVSDVQVENGKVAFCYRREHKFSFPGVASFLVVNAAMALLMAEQLGVDLKRLPSDWSDFRLPEGRFSIREIGDGIRAIYDGYNASPKSFEKALETFSELPVEGRRFVVFSDMRELGAESKSFHKRLGEQMAFRKMDGAFAYGEEARSSVEVFQDQAANAVFGHFEGPEDLARHLEGILKPGDCVLFKASRGMKIERVLQSLQTNARFAPGLQNSVK